MNFLEKAAMKILERGLRDKDKPAMKADRRRSVPYCAEHNVQLNDGICPICRDASGNPFVLDMQSQSLGPAAAPQDLERMQAELLYYRRLAAQREAELLELQRVETLGNIEEHHRTKQIRAYLDQIERLNLTIPGGLRSQPTAEDGEDQDLVNEAWTIFCQRRRGGSSRLG